MAREENPSEEKPPVSKILEETDVPSQGLPEPPGTKRKAAEKKQAASIQILSESISNSDEKTTPTKQKISPLTIAIAALAFLLIVIMLKPNPGAGEQQNVAVEPDTHLLEEIQNIQIKQSQLEVQVTAIQKQRDEAKQLVETLQIQNEKLQTRLTAAEQASKDNRNYISTIYRQLLDLQLKIEAVGGGYGNIPQKEPEERVINPYIGEGNLP